MLTCEEVNRALAERRGEAGWTLPYDLSIPLHYPAGGAYEDYADFYKRNRMPRDYCRDWCWAGVLFAELLHMAHSVYISFPPRVEKSCFSGTAMTPGYTQELWHLAPIDPDEFPEAIARARWRLYEED